MIRIYLNITKMSENKKYLFKKTLFVVSLILIANIGAFFLKIKPSRGFTGMSIKEVVFESSGIALTSKIFLAFQWGILLLLLLFLFFRDKRFKIKENELKGLSLKNIQVKNGTDLDNLHALLKNKKTLRISTISEFFKVDEDTVLEWGKILESGNLATIEYPTFDETTLKIVE
jgi:hypothetical protein